MFELSRKELEVLQLVSEGFASNEVAERCGKSIRTVDHQMLSVMRKLGVRKRQDAVSRALQRGLIKEG